MMTLTDRYSNDNKTRTYLRIHDPGHSWLEVPAKDVRDAAGVTSAVVGARTGAQLRGILSSENFVLPAPVREALDEVSVRT